MLLDDLKQQIQTALKAGDKARVETLRYLVAAINNIAIAKYGSGAADKLTEADCLEVVKKQVKTHRESIEAFVRAGRSELAQQEKAQLTILESFLPAQMSDNDLKKILEPIVSSEEKNFGLLMKQAMAAVAGQADGGKVASLLKQMLQAKQ